MLSVLTPIDLRVEYDRSPLGLDEPKPRFGWRLTATGTGQHSAGYQTAYQLRVGTSAEVTSDMWDSGRVDSERIGQVEYAGEVLEPFRRYYWSVRVWNSSDQASAWSEPAWFEMGPLSPADWGGASWIARRSNGEKGESPAPLLRKRFRLDGEVASARLYVCGLGFGEFFLNGERVGDAVLDPAPTNYDATVLFSSYDVTGLLAAAPSPESGACVLAAHLGRGRYNEPTPNIWRWHEAPWRDEPKLIALLLVELADGRTQRIVSDETWRAVDGPIRDDSLFAGERYDARLERPGWTTAGYDDTQWPPAVAASPPKGVLRAQTSDQIRPTAQVPAVGLAEPLPGVHVFDLGRQLAGWARLAVRGEPGTAVRIRYGERLHEDGTVDVDQGLIYREIQTDTYVVRGDGAAETYEPRFSYKGFRYVQVDGLAGRPALEDLVGVEVHTAVESTLELACDNELVSRLHVATRRAVLNNLHGVPTDTPVFEKNGWTGDAHLTADVAAYNFWMPRFYTKWLRDWADSQLPSGEFPPIVPTSGWGYRADSAAAIKAPIPAWDVAYLEIPWVMYRHYGDERILARHYDGARRYIDYLVSGFLTDDVVLVGLGDWLPPGVGGMPPEGPGVYETVYTYRFVELLSKVAGVLGRDGDIAGHAELSERIRGGFNRAFFDASAGIYHGERETGYRQAANVMALAFGLVPDSEYRRVFDNLVADIQARDDHLDTGVIGTKFLLPLLTREGLVDLAFKVAMQPTYPSYGFWLAEGATALYEHWGADSRSRNHHFFGHVDQWFVEDLAGLRAAAPGYARVTVRPCPPAEVGELFVGLESVRGRIGAGWRRVDGGVEVRVEVPVGVEAEVWVPGADAGAVVGAGVHVVR